MNNLSTYIPFTRHPRVVNLAPTRKHCERGLQSSASISMPDILMINDGFKETIEIWDQVERRMYVIDAKEVLKPGVLYHCNSSEFMAFRYKTLPQKVPA